MLMRKTCLILLFVVLFAPKVFCDTRYQYFAEDFNGEKYYLDTQSISYTNNSNVIRFWLQIKVTRESIKNRMEETVDKKFYNMLKKVSEIKSCIEIDFSQNTKRTIQSLYYSSKGKVLYTYNPYFQNWEPIPPGTIAEAARDAVKRAFQNNNYGQSPKQPFISSKNPELPLDTPQQRQEFAQLQYFSAWLLSQPDFAEFDNWYLEKLRQTGQTHEQIMAWFHSIVRNNGGHYLEIRRILEKWYWEFHKEKYEK